MVTNSPKRQTMDQSLDPRRVILSRTSPPSKGVSHATEGKALRNIQSKLCFSCRRLAGWAGVKVEVFSAPVAGEVEVV
jgi:hypothetical protein